MNYMVTLKSLGLLLACMALLPLAQAAPETKREDRSNDDSAAENVKAVPEQPATVDPLTVNPLPPSLSMVNGATSLHAAFSWSVTVIV